MPRRSSPRPADPQAILLRRAQERALERERAKDPQTWSVANDTVDLPSGQAVDVVVGHAKRVVHARRANPFDTLYRAGALQRGQHQAANRLFRDWCQMMGIRTEDPRPVLELIQQAGSAELIPQKQIDAGRRYDRVLSYVGQADAELLRVLVAPAVMCGSVVIWRAEVEKIAQERERHAQGAVVRRACENLRLAFERYDTLDVPLEAADRERRTERDQRAIAREA